MPPSDHVDQHGRPVAGGEAKRAQKARKGHGRRRGTPVDLNDQTDSLLSPIFSHLPSLTDIPSLKGFFPTSPSKPSKRAEPARRPEAVTVSRWQTIDLGAGRLPHLLVSSQSHALQVFAFPSGTIPDDPHVQEAFPAPEEVFNIISLRYDEKTERSALNGEGPSAQGERERVLDARLLSGGELSRKHGPVVALLTVSGAKKPTSGSLALVIVSLRTGCAVRRVELGRGSHASLAISPRAFAIAVSHPTPTMHLLHPATLLSLHPPLTDLPASVQTALPVLALSGRLLAYTTSERASQPGPAGLGTISTSRSLSSSSSSPSRAPAPRSSLSDLHTAQGAILTSAAEIGGGVARGVWAGIKMGARAANKARNGRLARSAPAEGSTVLVDDERGSVAEDEAETRSLAESSVLDEGSEDDVGERVGGEWIKIIDLFPGSSRPAASRSKSGGALRTAVSAPGKELIAHFRLPLLRQHSRSDSTYPTHTQPIAQPVSHLAFSPDGTRLFAAPADGKAFHVLDVHPASAMSHEVRGQCKGQVWHMYELRRGTTTANVCEVAWSADGRWLGVETGKGTIHVFPLCTSGGAADAASHATPRPANPSRLQPLSVVVTPVARLRPPRPAPEDSEIVQQSPTSVVPPGSFAFTSTRRHPLLQDTICQDIAMFQPNLGQLELARLSVRPVISAIPPQPSRAEHSVGKVERGRASALTEMMRQKAGLTGGSDLAVEARVKARWLLPSEAGDEVLVRPAKTAPTPAMGSPRLKSLAHAEIQSHTTSPRLLPPSIYLSHQFTFSAARPVDDYSPLSVLDPEARQQRLTFRHEVEARSGTPDLSSFDEPLLSALHSVLDSPSPDQATVPRLPNGHTSRWTSLPIRHVAANLGEGVDKMRREYVRAQHKRTRRRQSEALANRLSFEDDAVFASGGEGEGDEGSSPSSGVLPDSLEGRDEPGEDEWGAGWEEEYRRAVEEDEEMGGMRGEAEDLMIGVMDEEGGKWAKDRTRSA